MTDGPDQQRILDALSRARTQIEELKKPKDQRIAIIGMAGRFPGAENLDEFWDLLREGRSGVREVTEEELKAAGVPDRLREDPDYVRSYASFEEATAFDASFFGYSPREAEVLDPQHRVFLECAWHAMEDAGYDSQQTSDRIGVYAGSALNSYLVNLAQNENPSDPINRVQAVVGNVMGLMPTRVSYHLDLKGPSCGIQTGCSTSLVSLHEACRALLDDDCEIALSGGVTVSRAVPEGYLHEPGGIASPDGCCRAFDTKGKGTLFGNGVGVLVLKKFEDAIRDRDNIRAIILGTAINNDGSDKVGLIAPSVSGQAEVIRSAYERASVSPSSVSYVEGHGTATEMGDPVEFRALDEVMGDELKRDDRVCTLGSVKSNVGHLDAAAGVAGVIKTVLAMENRALPPTLYFESANPQLGLERSPFSVSSELQKWTNDLLPRRAGVSSFGMGGTNAHAILEEAPSRVSEAKDKKPRVFPLSAKSNAALQKGAENLVSYLESSSQSLGDIAHTLQVGRRALPHRMALVAGSNKELVQQLKSHRASEVKGAPPVIFLFSGQGSQYSGMAAAMMQECELFRDLIQDSADLLEGQVNLKELLTNSELLLEDTSLVQPVLFTLEYAMARVVMSWGVEPAAMLGHSLGEYVAACLSGVFTLSEALRLVAARGRAMQACEPGQMIAIRATSFEVQKMLTGSLEIAATNSPDQTVVSGPQREIESLNECLKKEEIASQILATSHAFHSASMEPALREFESALREVELKEPQLDLISNRTGTWLSPEQAMSVDYWLEHLRHTVRFTEGVSTLHETLPNACYLELGPGQTLCRFVQSIVSDPKQTIATLPGLNDVTLGSQELRQAQALLWERGAVLNWHASSDEKFCRVSLPGYPFERTSHYLPLSANSVQKTPSTTRLPEDEWYSLPIWRQQPLMAPALSVQEKRLLLLGAPGDLEVSSAFDLIRVDAGASFEARSDCHFLVDPHSCKDFERLIESLGGRDLHWVYAWSFNRKEEFDSLASVTALAQALQKSSPQKEQSLDVLISNGSRITGSETLSPTAAALSGFLNVLEQEVPHLHCRLLDVDPEETYSADLCAEWQTESSGQYIAYRHGLRWEREYQPCDLPQAQGTTLRKGGTYLVIGDLEDGLGLVYAKALREKLQGKIIVLGKASLPEPSDWDTWLASHGEKHPTSQTVQRIKALGREGVEFVMGSAQLSDPQAVLAEVTQLRERLNEEEIDGLFYADVMGGEASCALAEMDSATLERIYQNKLEVISSINLLLKEEEIGFAVLQSTLSSIVGGQGFSAYAASGAYLDCFASSVDHPQVVAINWDACDLYDDFGEHRSALMTEAMSPEEVWQATVKILAQPSLKQVIVSPRSLAQRGESRLVRCPTDQSDLLGDEFAAPQGSVELAVAQAMGDLLGIQKIGRNDDFFALGGHSLLAIQAISKLRKEFQIEVPMRAILQGTPTVAGISLVIEESLSKLDGEDILNVESFIDQIEKES